MNIYAKKLKSKSIFFLLLLCLQFSAKGERAGWSDIAWAACISCGAGIAAYRAFCKTSNDNRDFYTRVIEDPAKCCMVAGLALVLFTSYVSEADESVESSNSVADVTKLTVLKQPI